jgi:hypothetical protein
MPKYSFKCTACDNIDHEFVSVFKKESYCKVCDAISTRLPPRIKSPTVNETISKYTNTKNMKDQSDIILERSEDHYWRVEVPKLVDSGKYSLQTMKDKGWVELDGKGGYTINRKPPYKRK